MGFTAPTPALDFVSREQVRPGAGGEIELHLTLGAEHRRDEQLGAEHVLPVEVGDGGIVGELHHHRAHDGHAGGRRVDALLEQVRHETHLELGEDARDIHRLFVELPRHPVGLRPVEAGVAPQEPECGPALEDPRIRGALEAADVVAPEREPAGREREAAAEGLGHRRIRRGGVAAPVHRHGLPAGRRRTGEQHGVTLSPSIDEHFVDRGVEQVGVEVVHARRVGAVEVHHVGGDALAEVGLEAVDSLLDESAQVRLVPRGRMGVREVDQRHACLPHVPLPHRPIRPCDQESLVGGLAEQR